jgi:hypothetical protein
MPHLLIILYIDCKSKSSHGIIPASCGWPADKQYAITTSTTEAEPPVKTILRLFFPLFLFIFLFDSGQAVVCFSLFREIGMGVMNNCTQYLPRGIIPWARFIPNRVNGDRDTQGKARESENTGRKQTAGAWTHERKLIHEKGSR